MALEQKLGRNKSEYPITGYWYNVDSEKWEFIDYKQVEDIHVSIDNTNLREKENIATVIETETVRNYMEKDKIKLLDGTTLLIERISRKPRERKSKILSSYLNNKYVSMTIYLGKQ